jgi:nucleotide-sensitive chloride channel 1A
MAPITLITAVPTYITKEQLDQFQSTTPASGDFTHDPVLHHIERAARITLDPALDGFEVDSSTTGDVYVTEGSVEQNKGKEITEKLRLS